jgi:hypothetical protein
MPPSHWPRQEDPLIFTTSSSVTPRGCRRAGSRGWWRLLSRGVADRLTAATNSPIGLFRLGDEPAQPRAREGSTSTPDGVLAIKVKPTGYL